MGVTRIVFDCPSELAAAVSLASEGSASRTEWIIRALEAVLEAEGQAPTRTSEQISLEEIAMLVGPAPSRTTIEGMPGLCERVRRAWRLDARQNPALAILRALAEDRVSV